MQVGFHHFLIDNFLFGRKKSELNLVCFSALKRNPRLFVDILPLLEVIIDPLHKQVLEKIITGYPLPF